VFATEFTTETSDVSDDSVGGENFPFAVGGHSEAVNFPSLKVHSSCRHVAIGRGFERKLLATISPARIPSTAVVVEVLRLRDCCPVLHEDGPVGGCLARKNRSLISGSDWLV